jgi:hypothetical protein
MCAMGGASSPLRWLFAHIVRSYTWLFAHIVRSYMVIVTYGAHNGRMPLHAPTLPCA